MGIFGKTNARTRVPGFHVSSSVYGKAIPVIMGRVRANPILIFAGNFQSRSTNNKKGKGTKKLGNMQAYSFSGDYLLGYMPIICTEHIWVNKDTFYGVLPSTQTFNLTGTFGNGSNGFAQASVTVSNNPGQFAGIFAVTWVKPFSVTYNDYGGPGSVSLSGTENEPIYNGGSAPLFSIVSSTPNQVFCIFGGFDATHPGGDPHCQVFFDPPQTNPSITVYYFYAEPSTGGQVPLASLGLQFENELGNGSEFNYPGGSSFRIVYPEFAGIGAPFVDCGASNMAPNISIGVIGSHNLWPSGDTSPADVILDIILSGNFYQGAGVNGDIWNHGLNFVAGLSGNDLATQGIGFGTTMCEPQILDDFPGSGVGGTGWGLTSVRNYCLAYGIKGSHYADAQRPAKDWINDFAEMANCYVVWNGTALKFIPRCEISAHGNGASFVAPTASGPVYTITDSQFIAADGEDAVIVARNENLGSNTQGDNKRQIPNILPIQHVNPGLGGSAWAVGTDLITTIRDESDIQNFGPCSAQTRSFPFIRDPGVALRVGWPIMRRGQFVDPIEFRFTLPASHFLLDPADLITLNPQQQAAPELPTNPCDVRIKTISINENDELECTAEPFYYGAHCPNTTQTPPSTSSGGDPSTTYPVGNVNTPVIFEAVARLANTTNSASQIWIVVSNSDAQYGGCSVWLSTDGGNTYLRLNSLLGNGVTGLVYSSNYPAGSDPDTTDNLFVDLTESLGTLASFNTTQRDSFQDVIYMAPGGTLTVNGKVLTIPYELGAYTGVSLQSTNKYELPGPGNGIRRGVFTTPIVAHNIGQRFAYLGNGGNAPGIFKLIIDPTWYGLTLFFKFTSFNQYLQQEQALSAVTAYSFSPTGAVGGGYQQNNAYTLTSSQGAVVLYQGKPAGWGSIGQPTWTSPTKIYMLSCTANFPSGPAPYAIEISPTEAAGTYYVTYFDPGFVGGSSSSKMHYDANANNANTPGFTYMGKIVLSDMVNGGAVGSAGGNPSGGQIS